MNEVPKKLSSGFHSGFFRSPNISVRKNNYFLRNFESNQLAFLSGAVTMFLVGYIYNFLWTEKMRTEYPSLLFICLIVIFLSFFMAVFKDMKFLIPKLSEHAEKNTSFFSGFILVVLIFIILATMQTYDFIYETFHIPLIATISTFATMLFVYSRA